MNIVEFNYRVTWRASGAFAGRHRSRSRGEGFEFRGHVPLGYGGDPRRYDAHASIRDPMERLLIRVHEQRASIPVYALLDVSASMAFRGRARKLDVMADFVASLGYSAYRTGDSFGAIACDERVRQELLQPLSRAKGAGVALAAQLRSWQCEGSAAEGLITAARLLGGRRSLVFVISDFHLHTASIESLFGELARHTVVPVVLLDTAEFQPADGLRLMRIADPETGRERTVVMRPALRERLRSSFERRRETLTRVFGGHGSTPLWVVDRFQADEVTRYFFG